MAEGFVIRRGLTPNNGTLTIEGSNGLTGSGTFTADQAINATITLSADIASQAEAEAGSNDAKAMTPLKTKQYVDEATIDGGTF